MSAKHWTSAASRPLLPARARAGIGYSKPRWTFSTSATRKRASKIALAGSAVSNYEVFYFTAGVRISLARNDHALITSQWRSAVVGDLQNHMDGLAAHCIRRHEQICR
jgi:hypothetical protein